MKNPASPARTPGASVPPGGTLGVLGGGQLGRMFCHAAQARGYRVCVLDPLADGPAGAVADEQVLAAYDDPQGLDDLARRCSAVTTEFENVPARSLEHLERRLPVRPQAAAVAIAQDRLREKAYFVSCGVAVAPHAPILTPGDCEHLDPALFPGILKTARLGYDGKGQVTATGPAQLRAAWAELQCVPCILEKRMPLAGELSVLVARGADAKSCVFPVSENEHRAGILSVSILPARIDAAQAAQAQDIALRVAEGLGYVGVLCVELFALADGSLLVNEMAPRPHNSGHATIEACVSSQFDQQVRTLAGLPLGDTSLRSPAVMLNLLGDLWFDGQGQPRAPDFAAVMGVPGACLHLYGKAEARPGRKMGHVTVLGPRLDLALERARAVAAILHLALPASLAAPDRGS